VIGTGHLADISCVLVLIGFNLVEPLLAQNCHTMNIVVYAKLFFLFVGSLFIVAETDDYES